MGKSDKIMRLQYPSSIEQIVSYNESFDACTLRVCYKDENRNGSSISKEVIEAALPSIYNCPVVCNYSIEDDTIGSHDSAVVNTEDGLKLVNLTSAVGVVPQGSPYRWEMIEDNGEVHEYLCIDAIIWKRSPAYEKLKREGVTSQSMEITVKEGRLEDGIFVIERFIFTAFCLLGDDVEPCFESASLEMFGLQECKNEFSKMMAELKQAQMTVNTSQEADIYTQNHTEGGELLDQKIIELLAAYGITDAVEQLDFDIDGMSVEDLEAALKEKGYELAEQDAEENAGEDPADEEAPENAEDGEEDAKDEDGKDEAGEEGKEEAFALTAQQTVDALHEALHKVKFMGEWGECYRFCYCDHDEQAHEVYCYDVSEGWNLYGFAYTLNGDNAVIDFACKKRKKFTIVDFDEGDGALCYEAMLRGAADTFTAQKEAELREQFAAEKTELEGKFNTASDTIEQLNTELAELRSFKQNALNEERAAQEEAVFAMFEDLKGVEAFEALRTACADISIEELEDKCYALRGRTMNTQNFSATKPKSTRLPIEKKHDDADEPYGGLFKEFPPCN